MRNAPTRTLPLHPPKPRLAFRVGVSGHRHDRLAGADHEILKTRLHDILDVIRRTVEEFGASHSALFSDQPPVVRALTPLAEGSDRLFASAALEAGLALCCPLPFAQPEFERDFVAPSSSQPGSLDEFRSLLARARDASRLSLFEMDGDPARRSAAYAACGQVVVHQSDVLCVVWDGERRQLTGGTEYALDYAARRNVPIVWIDARAPHHWQVIRSPAVPPVIVNAPATASAPLSELRDVVLAALRLPEPAARATVEEIRSPGIDGFYRERWPSTGKAIALPWDLFNRGLGLGSGHGHASPPRSLERDRTTADSELPHSEVVRRLHGFLEWPDRLAVSYSNRYRSSFVVTYLLAAMAVGMALLPLALGWDVLAPHLHELPFIVSELVMIGSILLIVWRGRKRGWHERWLDYRLAAEFIRQIRFVTPLGGSRALPPQPWHATTYGHAGSTWMAWYAQAVHREIGLPSASLDRPYLVTWLEDVLTMIDGQSAYHAETAARSARIEHRLHRLGVTLLSITLLAGALHFWAPISHAMSPPMVGSLIFVCGFLPALGAALAGIGNQAEFRRVAKRSTAMHEHFEQLAAQMRELLAAVKTGAPRPRQVSDEAGELALRATEYMINEVLDWRVVFIDRPLDPPA